MIIFKKGIRTWFTFVFSLLILTIAVHYLAMMAYRSDAAEIETDPRYAKISAEIHNQNLDVEKVRTLASSERSSVKNLFHFAIGILMIFGSFTLIFRCVARVLFSEWKSPWIS